MTPEDLRDSTWHTISRSLAGRLREVYDAWLAFGPLTTRQLADRSGIDLLNVRPRTHDLCAVGLVMLSNHVTTNGVSEGIYRVRTIEEWERWKEEQMDPQGHLPISDSVNQ